MGVSEVGKKVEKEQTYIGGKLISGLPQSNIQSHFTFKFEENRLKITEIIFKMFKKDEELQVFWLDMDKIISIDLITEDNIEEKQKSVVGRGVAGAILFGPVGAIIGSASGTKSKKTVEKTGVLVFSYYGKGEEDIKTINVSIVSQNIPVANKFINYYQIHYVKDTLEQNENGDIIL